MLEGFICPDGTKIKLQECLLKCFKRERCLTLPSLKAISSEREWTGIPSTTQLLNGTMMEFLKLTKPYYVDPDTRAFMLQGIRHHQQLEKWAKELNLPAEIPLSVDRDIFDLLEWEDDKLVMTDYKLWGSFRVAKALGLTEVGKQPDYYCPKCKGKSYTKDKKCIICSVDMEYPVYKTTSKYGKAGEPKMISIWERVPELADTWEQDYQLNRYRVMLKALGVTVHKLQLQVTVRDGGLFIAKERGIFRNVYKIPIQLLPDEEVISFFEFKENCLKEALDKGSWDIPCSNKESWEGERCKNYCDVKEYCPKGGTE